MTATRRSTRPSPRPQPREVDPEFDELIETWLNETPEIDVEAELETDTAAEEIADEREVDVPSRVSIGLVGTLAFIFVFGALFGLAAFHSVLVQNQLRLDRLSRDVEREQARYQELRIEYGQAAAPFRILAQAGARGMLQSKSKEPLQAVLPEQGVLSAPNARPFGNVSNFVPPVVSAPPTTAATATQTTVPEATVPQTTVPPPNASASTVPASTAPTATTPVATTAPTATTTKAGR